MKLCKLAALVLLPCLHSFGQQQPNEITIEVTDGAKAAVGAESPSRYLNGYHSSISGQTISYHSSDPDADSALLVRGQDVAPSISWETEAVPDKAAGDLRFIWLAGVECAGFAQESESHTFTFLINGQPRFAFQNRKDATAKEWSISEKDGAELTFKAVMTDKAGDLFGYMTLKVPARDFPGGKPLVLEVRGDHSGSADWYMTFQHSFNFVPQVRAEPALIKDGGRVSQSLRLSLDNLVNGRTMTVRTPTQEYANQPLKIGSNVLELSVPEVTSAANMKVVFRFNGQIAQSSTVRVEPVKSRKIYLLPYSHNDIGYTDLQADVERKQWENLEEGMRLIRETRGNPVDARFKWNLETIWALESYLKQASPSQREEFIRDVKEGSIGVSALFANMLTGLANADEMSHFFDFARELRAEYQFLITAAVTSDVPGFSWGMVSAMAQNGVRYFATAPNYGDRIGYTLEAWGDKPFYWTSQSGREKVLMWMAGASYSSFHEGTLAQLGSEKIMKLVRKLDQASYPYEMVHLPYTLGDNGLPDATLADFVKQWNEHYVTPRLILATHEQMFREFEKRYGAELPVVKGDFTPYWEDGAASSAYEMAVNRGTVDRLIQGEALWSMLAPDSFPAAEDEAAWRNVIFYDEHTWGAHNSIEAPDLPFVKQQWDVKRRFALDADSESKALLRRALHRDAQLTTGAASIQIYNTNSWPRTDVVFLARAQSSAGDRVIDSAGVALPSQRLSTGELAVLVKDIAPFSSKRLTLTQGEPDTKVGAAAAEGNRLENEFLSLSVDPQTGVISSLKVKKDQKQLVDTTGGNGLDEYIYVPGTDPQKARRISNVRVQTKERGPVVVSLLIEGDAPGARHYSSEVRVVAGIDRVDLITNVDKAPIREKEGVHVAFPFNVPGGQLRYDVADGVVRPEADQLKGACKNFFSVESWVDVSNLDYGVTWATANAPLVEIGAITAELPWMKSTQTSPLIYSYVMNNYWHTNYKADQEGPVAFAYSIQPHAGFDAAEAAKFGAERRQPLIVSSGSSTASEQGPLLELSSRKILVTSIRPVGRKRWLAHVYNPTAESQKASLRWQNGEHVTLRWSDAGGAAGERVGEIEIPAFGSAYVLISGDHAAP